MLIRVSIGAFKDLRCESLSYRDARDDLELELYGRIDVKKGDKVNLTITINGKGAEMLVEIIDVVIYTKRSWFICHATS
jgi:hypothetical protein